jgi:TRAP-type mannitol/chloroaromatic compound transport system permease large subunit
VSIVIVGAFLAASTGIVGATVVTMGLLALPTMLRNNYSPELATGVIAASGTLGQIIPPSIVIVLLGTLVGDLYATGQETRAQLAGCSDALTYLGEPAVLSVGTLFQAALLPGIFLAGLYAAYAFGFALVNPSKAPPVELAAQAARRARDPQRGADMVPRRARGSDPDRGQPSPRSGGLVGSQTIFLSDATQQGEGASLGPMSASSARRR